MSTKYCFLISLSLFLNFNTQAQESISIGVRTEIESMILNESRVIRVYTPESYNRSSLNYPVIYVLDGEVSFLQTVSTTHFLSTYGFMPEVIVVAIHNTNRFRDMPIPDRYGQGNELRFLEFLTKELVPNIEKKYRTHPLRILVGHSQGGLFSTYTAVSDQNTFNWFVSMDAPLFDVVNTFKEQLLVLVNSPSYQGRYITVDRKFGWLDDWSQVEKRLTSDILKTRFARFEASPNETHESMTYEGTYKAIKHLFSDYSPKDILTKNLSILKKEYQFKSEQYNYKVSIPTRLLTRNIDDLIFQARTEEAQELLDYLIENYGSSANTSQFQSRINEAIEQGPLDETVEDILNSEPPSPTQMKPYLGEWNGRIETSFPMDASVTFNFVENQIKGTIKLTFPDGATNTLELVVIRILEDGTIEFGYMNQMRPRGVIMNSGKLISDNELGGIQEMKGVRAKFPPGFNPKEVHFRFLKEKE